MDVVESVRSVTLEALDVTDGYAALGARFIERLEPTPLPDPYLIAVNPDAAELVGVPTSELERPEFLRLAAGCARFTDVHPFSAAYAGHQFGQYAGQLGDGRAITLGEIATANGPFEWQVKGAGLTPFSRFGDGRAVLRSTIREYLCSEAMAGLGIPTTRALAIAGSNEPVYRETRETAAVLTRIAPTHLRFGTFELFHYRGDFEAVKIVADYAIARFFPDVAAIENDAQRYAAFLRDVVSRTARLMAHWQSVGFAHGVMNTDNMSIIGLTLDYGPFGFLDTYDAGFICNHTDAGGRYAFDRQPTIGLWNCHALAAALGSLIDENTAKATLADYEPAFRRASLDLLRAKFGLLENRDDDATLFVDAFAAMQEAGTDYTRFFRGLGRVSSEPTDATWQPWFSRYRERLSLERRDDATRLAAMNLVNPKYILRNYIAQRAIDRAVAGDYSEIARVHETLRAPYDEWPDREGDAQGPPPGEPLVSVSCSS